MSAALGLYRLQQVDRQIDQAQTSLSKIKKSLEDDAELKQAVARFEQARAAHYQAGQELKNAEAETTSQRNKIQQTESSLYGGRVQNPKELQDLQMEAASLKKYLATLEERELEWMVKFESAEQGLQEANAELEKLQSRLGTEHRQLLTEQSRLLTDMERLMEERGASVNPIEAGLIDTYDDLRRQKKGIAVASISDNACDACGANLTAMHQQIAKTSRSLTFCPSCGRILYAS